MIDYSALALSFTVTTIFSLAANSYFDLKTRRIDSRLNYLAFGATAMIIAALAPSCTYIVAALAVGLLSRFMFRNFMSSGDFEALAWIYLFLASWRLMGIAWFLFALDGLSLLVYLAVRLYTRQRDFKIPFYPIILGAYIISFLL